MRVLGSDTVCNCFVLMGRQLAFSLVSFEVVSLLRRVLVSRQKTGTGGREELNKWSVDDVRWTA